MNESMNQILNRKINLLHDKAEPYSYYTTSTK
jgi:hypothetical protein